MVKAYVPRVIDEVLKFKLETFGAVNLIGPRGCGKTLTAKKHSKSVIYLRSYSDKDSLNLIVDSNPDLLLNGGKPRLIDEWQDAPELWDLIRFDCDHADGPGQYILTGSTSKKVSTSHTGTGRITQLRMYPMSLYESGESNGSVSLLSLFDNNPLENGCKSDLPIEKLAFACCRGGWPYCMNLKSDRSKLEVAKDYFRQVCYVDLFDVDEVVRNSGTMESIMRTYSRNLSTLSKKTTMCRSMFPIVSEQTFDDYLTVLKKLYVVDEVPGWCPSLRSSAGERSGPKREFSDPSLAVAGLGTSPKQLLKDFNTFGSVFECLCIRDLKVYSGAFNGKISYYHDRYDLEVDCVLHLDDGRYALIEFKLGSREIEKGAEHLNEVERLIIKHNEDESQVPLNLPSVKLIVTSTEFGYRRKDGVYVVPIGCLCP